MSERRIDPSDEANLDFTLSFLIDKLNEGEPDVDDLAEKLSPAGEDLGELVRLAADLRAVALPEPDADWMARTKARLVEPRPSRPSRHRHLRVVPDKPPPA
ncbi:MAG: hypothetical protein ACYDAG_19325 [Chloroflexota bacterium]